PNLLRSVRCAEAFVETLADNAVEHVGSNAPHDTRPNSSKNMSGLSTRRIQGTLTSCSKTDTAQRRNSHPHMARYVSKNAKENLDALVELRGSLAHVSDGSTQCLTRDGASVE